MTTKAARTRWARSVERWIDAGCPGGKDVFLRRLPGGNAKHLRNIRALVAAVERGEGLALAQQAALLPRPIFDALAPVLGVPAAVLVSAAEWTIGESVWICAFDHIQGLVCLNTRVAELGAVDNTLYITAADSRPFDSTMFALSRCGKTKKEVVERVYRMEMEKCTGRIIEQAETLNTLRRNYAALIQEDA